jgi:hypothetical protein
MNQEKEKEGGFKKKTAQWPLLRRLRKWALVAWRSGHRISLRDSRPGFESRQGIRCFRKNVAMLLCLDLICIVCVLKRRNKCIGPKIFKKEG